ncbi:GNAT family N-acetyltransferase [Pararhizobium mangrovi]|uniref:GNAT family N-acetyltransferase n=1 Tax=Pararhizobium mangrovi TaxID=2590452 RepID=A0A506UHN5_9HYPH|nr:GNAT family N-acetyltransferase [Pararhizobium mangrovi]TPW32827.1 GNAT family N-acetyltransferase [Pararhizobium mangrovi]
MSALTIRRNEPFDLDPLAAMVTDREELALVNPHAKYPIDPLEWREQWLQEVDDASFYLVDEAGRDVGFFALRVGVGPEVRNLVYVFVAPEARGNAGQQLAALAEGAAKELGALTLMLKVELDNVPALKMYRSAGFEELGESGGMATMRKDFD